MSSSPRTVTVGSSRSRLAKPETFVMNGQDHYQSKYSRNKPKSSNVKAMSNVKLEQEGTSSSKVEPKCLLCSFEAPTIQKLKTHLLLKHPKSNFCLFCVGKKGWSDDFASSSQYDEHYK